MKEWLFRHTNVGYFIAIIFIASIAYWDIATCKHTLKYDVIDANYPNQVFQSQLEQSGEIPLWDPFSYLGNAYHSKNQMYYPIRFISSKISEHTLCKLNYEFLFHIFLAGIGMFLFLRRLFISKPISLAMAVAYMLCGFFSGNAQHYWWIVSGALLPFVLLTYYNLLHIPNFKHLVLCVLVCVSFFFGGYPAFHIIVGYVLVVYTGIFFIQILRNKQYATLWTVSKYLIFFVLSLLVCTTVGWISQVEMVQMITRGDGVTWEKAMFGSLNPTHAVTYFFPLLTAYTFNNYWNIDPSMMNMHIGVFVFVCAICSLRLIRHSRVVILWFVTLLFVLLSFAELLPVRKFFYDYIPLFNLFRFPALFRLFYSFTLIVLAAIFIDKYFAAITKRQFWITLAVFTGIGLLLAILFFVKPLVDGEIRVTYWYILIEKLFKKHMLGIHGLVYFCIGVCVVLFAFIRFRKQLALQNVVLWSIVLFIVFDMILSVRLIAPITVVNHIDVSAVQKRVDALPSHTYIDSLHEKAYSQYARELALPSPLWRNNQLLYKKRTYDGYTSFIYKTTADFVHSLIFDSAKVYPLAYIPSLVYSHADTLFDYSKGRIAVCDTFFEQTDYSLVQTSISMNFSKANEFGFCIIASQSVPLVLMQNYYPGWKAYVNGKVSPIFLANYSCMGVVLPEGASYVQFVYKPTKAIVAYYMYVITLYILILLAIFVSIPLEYKKWRNAILVVCLLGFFVVEFKNYKSPQIASTDSCISTVVDE